AAPGWVEDRVDGCPYGCYGCYCGGGFGNHVAINHGSGNETIYGHMTSGSGIPGYNANLSCGTRIGASGSSGNSTGPHLHFEVRLNVSNTSYYSGASDDPWSGPCSGSLSYWHSQGSAYSAGCGAAAASPQATSACSGGWP